MQAVVRALRAQGWGGSIVNSGTVLVHDAVAGFPATVGSPCRTGSEPGSADRGGQAVRRSGGAVVRPGTGPPRTGPGR